jgi:hypothetical protein
MWTWKMWRSSSEELQESRGNGAVSLLKTQERAAVEASFKSRAKFLF